MPPRHLPTLSLALLLASAPAWGDSTTYFFGSPGTDVTRPDNLGDVKGSAIGLIGNARIRGHIGNPGTVEVCSTACNAFSNRVCFCTTLTGAPDANNSLQATFTCENGGLLQPESLSYVLAGTPANSNQTGTLTLFASRDYANYDQLDTKVLDNTNMLVTHDLSGRDATPMEVYELRPQRTPSSGQSKAIAQVDDLTLTGTCLGGGDTGDVISTGLVEPGQGYHAVCAVNNIKGETANPLIEIIDEAGNVTTSSSPALPAYASTMIMERVYGGKRWCRVTPATGDALRARIYHTTFPGHGSKEGSDAR